MTFFCFLLIFAILVLVHEWGHYRMAKSLGISVEKFSIGFGPVIFQKKYQDTLFILSLIPLGGYVKLYGDDLSKIEEYRSDNRAFLSKSPLAKIMVALAGPFINYIWAFLLFFFCFFIGVQRPSAIIGEIQDKSLAQTSGLQVSDHILSFGGESVLTWDDFIKKLHSSDSIEAESQALVIEREGEELTIDINLLKYREMGSLGVKATKGESVLCKKGFVGALRESLSTCGSLTEMTACSIWKLCRGKKKIAKSLTGPLGMYFATKDVRKKGITALLYFMALLSIALGFFNLLPLPALDGGQVVFFTIEGILKREVPLIFYQIFQYAGLSLILCLSFYVFYCDIKRVPSWHMSFFDKVKNIRVKS